MAVTLFPKKISVATMGFSTKELEEIAAAKKDGKPVPVVYVWGTIQDRKPGVSQFGNYVKFTGQIAAINLSTKEEARSSELLLPTIAEKVVDDLFSQAAKDGGIAQIALEITVTENKSTKGGTKFSYGVKPLIDIKSDALTDMLKKLPAPKMLK